jgi:Tol biopolymer transport system component
MPNGQGQRRLTSTPVFEAPYDSVAPEWSPDGMWVAFLTDRRGTWELWVARPDGSQQQPLLSAAQLEGISFQYEAQSEQVMDWGP